MKSELLLMQHVLDDIERRCCVSTTLDLRTIKRRVETEGLAFLTLTLASFGKDFERGLDQGYVDRHLFAGFRRKGALPRFLGGLLGQVFDRDSGFVLDEANIDSVQAIRQVTLMWSKVKIRCTPAREAKALQAYIECERELYQAESQLTSSDYSEFNDLFARLFGQVLTGLDEDVAYGRLVPKHGPGVTADRLLGNKKFGLNSWTTRLERVFPSSDFLIPNYRYWEHLQTGVLTPPGQEQPVKVILVPKTQKTPRIIAVEPTCMQYAQQAIAEPLVKSLERHDNRSRHFIGFEDQIPNQILACEGSRDGSLATIDLSEASDRVPFRLVYHALERWPHLRDAVCSSRSTRAIVDGRLLELTKFASMGSALCFPIEAMVFVTLVFRGIESAARTRMSDKARDRFIGRVRVYGDDIIIPVEYARPVVSALESFGFKVNSSKSFWTGRFRESCGKEYYGGWDVSIVKLRQLLPHSRADVESILSTVAMRNLLFWQGYSSTVDYLDKMLKKILKHFPLVEASSPILGRENLIGYQTDKIHPHYHSPLVKGWRVVANPPSNSIDGIAALQKFFLKRGDEPFADAKHLERSGRPKAVNIKLGYGSPF